MPLDYQTTSISDIQAVALEIVEAAYDLRAYELLGDYLSPEEVNSAGDTRYGFYQGYTDIATGRVVIEQTSTIQKDTMIATEYTDSSDVLASNLGHEFDYIPGIFDRYTVGDSSSYSAVDNACEAAAGIYCDYPSSMDNVTPGEAGGDEFSRAAEIEADIDREAQLGDWTGDFATDLREKVVGHIGNVSANQVQLLRAVQGATRMHWALVYATRRSIYSIGVQTRDALKGTLTETQEEHEAADDFGSAVMPVIGAMIAVASLVVTVATGGAGAPLTVAAFSTGAAMVNGTISLAGAIEEAKVKVEGDSVDEIITWMNTQISELDTVIAEEEAAILGAVQEVNAEVESFMGTKHEKDWQAFRPAAADYSTSSDERVFGPDGSHGDDFRHEVG